MKKAFELHVSGIVQGVGFRPFVYRLAALWKLTGWVFNASDGVHIHVEGEEDSLHGFLSELNTKAPPAARITTEVYNWVVAPENYSEFTIRQSPEPSSESSQANTLVSPDIATCPLCLAELFDPDDRRYHYPFINCTNCGPRFTIIDSLPYDRKSTSMAAFEMCEICSREYSDPLDRRFHAQPDACFECGPSLRLVRPGCDAVVAVDRTSSDGIIEEAVALIEAGGIVAIKGLGGYHLACDATNEEAVSTLRVRKHRPAKPFALMVGSLEDAQALCRVSDVETELLSGTVRPIVLLERRPSSECLAVGRLTSENSVVECSPGECPEVESLVSGNTTDAGSACGRSVQTHCALIAYSVAGDLHELGIMLPCTPLQHLLLSAIKKPLVMTSGNISEEPIISAEDEAHALLGGVADAFLDNDREILSRYDDSVVRVIDERVFMIRRARGYAPQPIDFPGTDYSDVESWSQITRILATGPEQKNCFCFIRGDQAFVSQHLGDLENASTFEAWMSTLDLYRRLFDLRYLTIACDKHPAYLSTQWARSQKEPLVEVQHHHAHIASVLAEYNRAKRACLIPANNIGTDWDNQFHKQLDRVIGITFDGTGYGEDGTVWGGEVLLASLSSYERFAHLHCVPLPGGQAAIRRPARMAWSYLRSLGLVEHEGTASLAEHEGAAPLVEHEGAASLAAAIGKDRLLLLDQIITNRINSPLTSSMGRLFDAVSALVGICCESSYEGQAAVELEAALYDRSTQEPTIDPAPDESDRRYRFAIIGLKSIGYEESNTAPSVIASNTAPSVIASTAKLSSDNITTLPLEFDPTPVLAAILDDLHANVSPAMISLRFHNAVARLIVDICNEARRQTGLFTVALSGGVFMNRYLLTRVIPLLSGEGFIVLMNHELPANDGCISYGQAAVAAARLIEQAKGAIL